MTDQNLAATYSESFAGSELSERSPARAARERAVLMRLARLISGDFALAELVAQLHGLLTDLMPADRVILAQGLMTESVSFTTSPTRGSPENDSLEYVLTLAHSTNLAGFASCMTRSDLERAMPRADLLPRALNSLVLVPLRSPGMGYSALVVEAYCATANFGSQDVELLMAMASFIAAALDRDRAGLEVRRRMDQLGAFSAVTSTVNEWVDVEQLARRFLAVFLNTTRTNYGLFYSLEAQEEMRLLAQYGVPAELVDSLRLGHLSLNPDVKRAFELGRLTVVNDLSSAALSDGSIEIAALIPIHALMLLPLRVKGHGIGLIVLGTSDSQIKVADREFLQGLADQAAQAVENARLFAESQRRFQEQSALRELAQRFLSAVTPEEVIERTLDALMSLLPGDYYEVLLPEQEGAFLLANGRGWRRGVVGRTHTVGDPRLHAGHVLQARLPVCIENFTVETRFQPADYLMRHQVVSGVCAPMLTETRALGLLGVYSRASRQFTEEQSHFLHLVAAQTAIALEKARHSLAATRRLDELILLNDVIAAANSQVSLDSVMSSVSLEIRELLQSDDVCMFFARTDDDTVGLEPALPLDSLQENSPGHAVASWVVREGNPLLVHDLARDLRFAVADDLHACLGAPMMIGDRVIGVVVATHPEVGRFDQNDLRLLTTLAGQIAAAIERARLLDETARRLAEISAMFDFSDKLRTATTEARLHELILRDAVSMLQAAGGSLQMLIEDGEALQIVSTENMPHRGTIFSRNAGGISWLTLERGETLALADVAADARVRLPNVFLEMHGGIVAPLRTPSGMLGTLFLGFSERGAPGHDKLRLATTIANLAAQALQRLRLHEQTMEQAASLAIALGDLEESYQATLLALSAALDARDRETEGHSQRVTKLALTIGRKLNLSAQELTNLERGALLHDVGKIGISDNILLKTGPLTAEERALMNQHPKLGYEMLKGIPFLREALPVVLYHQEMWDGGGYPEGLRGSEIPLTARIFAVADTFDAMTSTRPYRAALSHEDALREIRRCRGTQFDPVVVDIFLELFQSREGSANFEL